MGIGEWDEIENIEQWSFEIWGYKYVDWSSTCHDDLAGFESFFVCYYGMGVWAGKCVCVSREELPLLNIRPDIDLVGKCCSRLDVEVPVGICDLNAHTEVSFDSLPEKRNRFFILS